MGAAGFEGSAEAGSTSGERMGRVASVTALAVATFANREKAQTWLHRPTSALGDRRPIDLLDSEPGARTVQDLLHRIAHGIAA
jgi:putative toxin-antitoxin system antitoxin component (TIGR02293 family)